MWVWGEVEDRDAETTSSICTFQSVGRDIKIVGGHQRPTWNLRLWSTEIEWRRGGKVRMGGKQLRYLTGVVKERGGCNECIGVGSRERVLSTLGGELWKRRRVEQITDGWKNIAIQQVGGLWIREWDFGLRLKWMGRIDYIWEVKSCEVMRVLGRWIMGENYSVVMDSWI